VLVCWPRLLTTPPAQLLARLQTSPPDTLARTSRRLWRGMLDAAAWKFDKQVFPPQALFCFAYATPV
jgi:hypothetical protein